MVKLIETVRRCAAALSRLYPYLKRGLDILLSALLLFSCLPLFFVIAFGIRVTSPGPLFFRQVRMGRGWEPFLLYKFRTMSCHAPHDCATAELSEADRYITRFGAFLRKTSLDELPQLLNVLRGDMSLLGPRPVILDETDLILRRATCGVYGVRPGISGLSQIRGRDYLTDAQKTALDGIYVRRLSLWQDVFLLFATAFCVLFRRGVREGGRSR